MNRQQTPSFSVRSSHRFVNPTAYDMAHPVQAPATYYYNSTASQKKSGATSVNDHQNSSKGMSIKTSDTSVEDFY